MKARRKGTDSPFVEIGRVQLEGNDILYKAEVMEFQHDTLSTELETYSQMSECTDWNYYRIHAAIAAMQGILSNCKFDFKKGSDEIISKNAIILADALVEQLKKA